MGSNLLKVFFFHVLSTLFFIPFNNHSVIKTLLLASMFMPLACVFFVALVTKWAKTFLNYKKFLFFLPAACFNDEVTI